MANYAVSDLHGNYKIWAEIRAWLKPQDTLYILGDCADRGLDGWKIIKEALEMPNVVYIKGNHEELLRKAMLEYYSECPEAYPHYTLLIHNGGYETYAAWVDEGANIEYASVLRDLPTQATYYNKDDIEIIMTHAGYTPPNEPTDESELLWNRNHFSDSWNYKANALIVHGHTPITHIPEAKDWKEKGAYWYCGNHKVCLDTSCWRSNYCVVLELDNFDEHIFYLED